VIVHLELNGQLLPGTLRKQDLELPANASARDAAIFLKLNINEIGLVTINGVQSEMEDKLLPGSHLCFFPYLSGG
jgi:hypothetical protein